MCTLELETNCFFLNFKVNVSRKKYDKSQEASNYSIPVFHDDYHVFLRSNIIEPTT